MPPEYERLPELLLPSGTRIGRGSNLAFALWRMPREPRREALVFYAFCRAVDDIADSPALSAEEKSRRLAMWREALTHPERLPADLREVFLRHRVPVELPEEIIAGCESDISPNPPADFEELRCYCSRVAVAVGLVFNMIVGARSPGAPAYAQHLGLALQLTNILRDVAEDARMGRVYLPLDELLAHGLTPEKLLALEDSPALRRYLDFFASRAESHFSEAVRLFPPADARALHPAETMRRVYSELLRRIRNGNFAVMERRFRVPIWKKAALLLG